MREWSKSQLFSVIDLIQKEGGYGLQKIFESDYDGSCPCFHAAFKVDGDYCDVWGRCWRVSENAQDLNFYGPKDIADRIKSCLDTQKWYNPYTLILHDKPFLEHPDD